MSAAGPEITDFLPLPNFLSAANLPAEDRFTFSSLPSGSLSAWADACSAKYRQRISELETYLATVRFLRNAYTPAVSRLPNEILMRIFVEPSLTDCTHIRRVCRRWRSILLATCSFWAKCISNKIFDNTPRHQSLLRAALKHSGALAISIKLKDPSSAIWDTLSEHHARIAELTVKEQRSKIELSMSVDVLFRSGRMEKLQTLRLQYNFSGSHTTEHPRTGWDEGNLPTLRTLRVSHGAMSPSTVVASLVTLDLKCVYLAPAMLVRLVNKCPLLENLLLGIGTLTNEQHDDVTVIGNRTIGGPQLREINIKENPYEVARLLCLFGSINARTFVNITCAVGGRHPASSSIDFQQVFAGRPPMYRMCFEPPLRRPGTKLLVRVFSGSLERLRVSCPEQLFIHKTTPLLPPITVFIVNSGYRSECEEECDEFCVQALRLWDLPHLRRLEIPHASTSETKHNLVVNFLNRFGRGHRASELSLAWVIRAEGGRDAYTLKEELEDLLDVLRNHVNSGRPRLGRLELYAVANGFEDWEPFTGSIESGSDARLCSTIVEPFLAELQRWVEVVHIG